MVDEKLVIEKLQSLKNKVKKIEGIYMGKYLTPDQFCYFMDAIIEYMNDIKTDEE